MSEKTKRKEEWIQITQPDGEKMIASPGYIKKLLGLDLSNIYDRLQRVEYKIDSLEAPGRQEEILRLLQENGKHNLVWIRNRVGNYQWYDMDVLIKSGLIRTSKSGSVTMYSCVRDKR